MLRAFHFENLSGGMERWAGPFRVMLRNTFTAERRQIRGGFDDLLPDMMWPGSGVDRWWNSSCGRVQSLGILFLPFLHKAKSVRATKKKSGFAMSMKDTYISATFDSRRVIHELFKMYITSRGEGLTSTAVSSRYPNLI
jgi:hypothetical protein